MNNNELVAKNLRIVAYRPLELEKLMSQTIVNGLDIEMLKEVYNNVKEYPYAYELCTLWGVYDIDNLINPLFFVKFNGLNSNSIMRVDIIKNYATEYEYDFRLVDALTIIGDYALKQKAIVSFVISNNNEEIGYLIKKSKNKKFREVISGFEYLGKRSKVMFTLSIVSLFTFIASLLLLSLFVYLMYEWDATGYTLSYLKTIVSAIGIVIFVILLIAALALPIVNIVLLLKKKINVFHNACLILNLIAIFINLMIIPLFLI